MSELPLSGPNWKRSICLSSLARAAAHDSYFQALPHTLQKNYYSREHGLLSLALLFYVCSTDVWPVNPSRTLLVRVDERWCLLTGCSSGLAAWLIKTEIPWHRCKACPSQYLLLREFSADWTTECQEVPLPQLCQMEGRLRFGKNPLMDCGPPPSCCSFCWWEEGKWAFPFHRVTNPIHEISTLITSFQTPQALSCWCCSLNIRIEGVQRQPVWIIVPWNASIEKGHGLQ